ncbi:MAG: HTTM domain-containing protein [Nannocystaceae bacterium]
MSALRLGLRRFFFALAPVAPAIRLRRLLALWTAAYVAVRLPHVEELYCRAVLNDAMLYRVVDASPPAPALVLALVGLLALALVSACGRRGAGAASFAVACLFGLLVALEATTPRAYAALALIQWLLLGFAPGPPRRDARGAPRVAPRWATRLLALQFASVYAFAGLAKLCSPTWRSGAAVLYATRSPDYGGHLLSASVPLDEASARVIAWLTIVVELGVAIGLWRPRTRRWAMAAVVALHLGIALSLRISLLFHALMLAHLVLFTATSAAPRREEAAGA